MKRVEKYAWLVFVGLGLLWVVVGFYQAFLPSGLAETEAQRIIGMSWSEFKASSPAGAEFIRWFYGALGLLKISWSFLVLAITLTGYRRGEKWAWYTLWLVPAALLGQGIFDSVFLGDVNEMLQWIPITSISLLGLLLPIRRFFPRRTRPRNV